MSGTGNVDQIEQLRGIIQNFNKNQLRELLHVLARSDKLPEEFPVERINKMQEGELRYYADLPFETLSDWYVQQSILLIHNPLGSGSQIQTTGPTVSVPSTPTGSPTDCSASQTASEPPTFEVPPALVEQYDNLLKEFERYEAADQGAFDQSASGSAPSSTATGPIIPDSVQLPLEPIDESESGLPSELLDLNLDFDLSELDLEIDPQFLSEIYGLEQASREFATPEPTNAVEQPEEEELSEEERLERTKQMIGKIHCKNLRDLLRNDINDEQRKRINLKKGQINNWSKKDLVDYAKKLGTTLLEPRIQDKIKEYYRIRPRQLPEVEELSEEQKQERIAQMRQWLGGLTRAELGLIYLRFLNDEERQGMTGQEILGSDVTRLQQHATENLSDEALLRIHYKIKKNIDLKNYYRQRDLARRVAKGLGQPATGSPQLIKKRPAQTTTVPTAQQTKRRHQPRSSTIQQTIRLPLQQCQAIGRGFQSATGLSTQQNQPAGVRCQYEQEAMEQFQLPTEADLSEEERNRIKLTKQIIDRLDRDDLIHLLTKVLTDRQRGELRIQRHEIRKADVTMLRQLAKSLSNHTLLSLQDRIKAYVDPTHQFAGGFQTQQQVPSGQSFIRLPEGTQMLTWEQYLEHLRTQNAPENQNQGYQSAGQLQLQMQQPDLVQQAMAAAFGYQRAGQLQPQMQQLDPVQQAMAAAFDEGDDETQDQSPSQPQATNQIVSEPQQYQSMPRFGFSDPLQQAVDEGDDETQDQGCQDPENQ